MKPFRLSSKYILAAYTDHDPEDEGYYEFVHPGPAALEDKSLGMQLTLQIK